jgi:hypothetical protein
MGYAAGTAGAAGVTSLIRWAEQPVPQAELCNSAWLKYSRSTLLRHSSSSHLCKRKVPLDLSILYPERTDVPEISSLSFS